MDRWLGVSAQDCVTPVCAWVAQLRDAGDFAEGKLCGGFSIHWALSKDFLH